MTKTENLENLYTLEGRVPISKAIPFGLQHVLAMFVANVAPIMIVCSVARYNDVAFTNTDMAILIQNCMIIAGIGTLLQLYPIWRFGAKLPIVMGLSFTFLAVMMQLASRDYGLMVGAVIVGGVIEGILGLTYKYWGSIIKPIVSACVVTAIGFSILGVGVDSFAGGAAAKANGTYGDWQNLLVGLITLLSCLMFHFLLKGIIRSLYILLGMIVGYIVAMCLGMVDFSEVGKIINQLGVFEIPRLAYYTPKFEIGAIVSVTLVFLVSATETIGDASALASGGLGRNATKRELSGALSVDGFVSALSGGIFGCTPITSFSQNVGLITITKVVNRFAIMFGALIIILGGLFPPIGALLSTIPQCVLGGCTVIMFGAIVVAGINMLNSCGLNPRNTIIAATSLSVGIGVTLVDGFFAKMPEMVGQIFAQNSVAGVFVVALFLSIVLPHEKEKNESQKSENVEAK